MIFLKWWQVTMWHSNEHFEISNVQYRQTIKCSQRSSGHNTGPQHNMQNSKVSILKTKIKLRHLSMNTWCTCNLPRPFIKALMGFYLLKPKILYINRVPGSVQLIFLANCIPNCHNYNSIAVHDAPPIQVFNNNNNKTYICRAP